MNRGCEILFDRERDCEPRALALALLGTCFAILLQQRGHLVLHASAVAAQGGATLFCGLSGSGKSTLAAMLCRRGYAPLNDDGMLALRHNAYRPALVEAMGMKEAYLLASAALQRRAGIYQLSRRKNFGDAEPVLDLLAEHWNTFA